jgi:radical SAM protein with 4Fe4S-binding SPASM domain
MTQLTFIDPAGNFLTTLDDPNDPRLRKTPRKARYEIEEMLKLGEDKTIEFDPRLFIPGKKWDTLQLPTTDNCHLLCAHCVRTEKVMRPDPSFDTFKKFLSNFSPEMCRYLLLSDFGEPFLRKDILDILRYVKSQGFLDVSMVSTGILLTEKIAKILVEERLLSRIQISTEGATREGYETIRGADYGTFVSNIKSLSDLNAKANYPIFVEFNVTCFKDNLNELSEVMDLAHRLNVHRVAYVHLNPVTYTKESNTSDKFTNKVCTPDQHLDNCDPKVVRAIFREIHKKSEQYGIEYFPPEEKLANQTEEPAPPSESQDTVKTPGCDQFFKWVQVNSEGNVYPCCQIAKHYPMGNLHAQSFWDIWNGEVFSEFRKNLNNGNPNEFCRRCNIYNGKLF